MPTSTTQRKLASQFIAVTNATKENAQQYLKNANYNLDTAVDQYYNFEPALPPAEVLDLRKRQLGELFDSLRNEEKERNVMDMESILLYAEKLGVDMDHYEAFVLYEVTQCGTFGTLFREEFVEGWAAQLDEKKIPIKATVEAQKEYIRPRIEMFRRDRALYEKVYRHAFLAGREPQQKNVSVLIAIAAWTELFSPTLRPWKTAKVDFLDAWQRFILEIWKRKKVNRDMWNQTLEFVDRTMKDDTLGFWSEDQAWPGVIDDFVIWCRETGVVPAAKNTTNGMEVDE